jgi:hypothetical protein
MGANLRYRIPGFCHGDIIRPVITLKMSVIISYPEPMQKINSFRRKSHDFNDGDQRVRFRLE